MGMGEGGKDAAGSPPGGLHAPAHYCDQSQIRFDLDGVRPGKPVDRRDHLLLFFNKLILVHDNSHGVNAGGHVLKGNLIILKRLQHLPAEPDLRIHHILVDQDRAEILAPCNTGDDIA